jgi:hypothetical protein
VPGLSFGDSCTIPSLDSAHDDLDNRISTKA